MTALGRRIALVGLSIVGYLLCLQVLLLHGIYSAGGEGAGDMFAYWTAGRHVLEGLPVYGPNVGGYAAYLYPPPMAQLLAPLSQLPFVAFVWLWRAFELACLRVAVGSWRNAGLALLLWPPVIAELDAGNVHLVIAAAAAMTIRGDARAILPAALTKFASLASVPAALRIDPRGLAAGALLAGTIVLGSWVVAPDLWSSYVTFLPTATQLDTGWYNIGLNIPIAVRLGAAAALALAAVRWPRLAALAVTLTFPVLWLHSLSALVAIVATPSGRAPSAVGWRGRAPGRRPTQRAAAAEPADAASDCSASSSRSASWRMRVDAR